MKFEDAVNKIYLSVEVLSQMHQAVTQNGFLLLNDFLNLDSYKSFSKIFSDKSQEVYVPHKYRFSKVENSEKLFSSKEFLDFLSGVVGKKITGLNVQSEKFRHGNFTLLHDDLKDEKRIVFFYTICRSPWIEEAGGQTIFTYGDERPPFVFNVQDNSFALIMVPKGMRDFVKYIKHFAGKNEFVKIQGVI